MAIKILMISSQRKFKEFSFIKNIYFSSCLALTGRTEVSVLVILKPKSVLKKKKRRKNYAIISVLSGVNC